MSSQNRARDFSYDSAVWAKTDLSVLSERQVGYRIGGVRELYGEHRNGGFRSKCASYGSLTVIKEERGVLL